MFTAGTFVVSLGTVFADAYVNTSIFAYSEPVTIRSALNDWEGGFRNGSSTITHNWLETGVSYKKWKLGILKRYDYEMEFSPDTAEFMYRTKNKQALQTGKTYHLDLKARHSFSDGVSLSRDFNPTENMSLTIGASYLRGRHLTEGTLQGTATTLADNDYDFEFGVDYFYSEDSLFDREVQAPEGQGYSIDLSLIWEPNKDFTTMLTVKDLIGRIYWENAPHTTATATSDVKEYDENGYVVYKPHLSGVESNKDFTQTLARKITFMAGYQVHQDIQILGKIYHTKANTFYQAGAEYLFTDATQLQFLYMHDTNAVTLALKKKDFYFAVTSDSIDFNKAHTFGLNLYWLYQF